MKSKLQSTILDDLSEQIVDSEHKTAPTQSFGIPYVRTPNVKNTRLILDDAFRVSEETYKEWTQRIEPRPYDIILCREAPVGDSGMILPNQRVCLGQRTVLIRPNKKKIYPKYLLFLLNSPKIKHELLSNSGGTHVDHLNMKDIRNLKVEIPHSYDEQKNRGNLLFNLNSQIYSIENQNKVLEKIIQTIFKSWFIDFDGQTEFVYCEFREIPKGWNIVKLDDVSNSIQIRIKPSEKSDEMKYISLDSMPSSSTHLQDFLPSSKVNSSIIQFKKYDILFGNMRPYFKRVGLAPFDGITRTTTFVIRPKEEKFLYWLLFYLARDEIINYATSASVGSTIPYVEWDALKNYEVVKPDEKIIKKFNAISSVIMESVFSNMKMIRELTQTRDILLPKLMSR